MNRFGNVHTKIAMSRAVWYFNTYDAVNEPSTIPKAKQQFMMHGAACKSIRQPTFIDSPSATAEKKSVSQGTKIKEAPKLITDIICIFLLRSSTMFN